MLSANTEVGPRVFIDVFSWYLTNSAILSGEVKSSITKAWIARKLCLDNFSLFLVSEILEISSICRRISLWHNWIRIEAIRTVTIFIFYDFILILTHLSLSRMSMIRYSKIRPAFSRELMIEEAIISKINFKPPCHQDKFYICYVALIHLPKRLREGSGDIWDGFIFVPGISA